MVPAPNAHSALALDVTMMPEPYLAHLGIYGRLAARRRLTASGSADGTDPCILYQFSLPNEPRIFVAFTAVTLPHFEKQLNELIH
ncbi:hypothetical protein NMY22_g8080 [Coprinellus aureogranulatus]|nr:hypothetical protein NMY22_g8080 [Coprinellus aureogranulatus]